GAAPARGLDGTAFAQQPVGSGDCVGIDAELPGQLPDRGQLGAGREGARGNGLFDIGGDRLRARALDGVLFWHINNYVLVQMRRQQLMSAASPPQAVGQAYPPTSRTVPTRYRERARYDRATVHSV